MISCDSSAMNVAAATGTPQVAIIGPTDPARTGPYRREHAVVQIDLACRCCLKRRCRHVSCMQLIDPERVLGAAVRNFGL